MYRTNIASPGGSHGRRLSADVSHRSILGTCTLSILLDVCCHLSNIRHISASQPRVCLLKVTVLTQGHCTLTSHLLVICVHKTLRFELHNQVSSFIEEYSRFV